MFVEWLNLLFQAVIAATQIVMAAVAIQSVRKLSKLRTSAEITASTEAADEKNQTQNNPEIEKSPAVSQQNDYVSEIIDIFKRACEQRSNYFDNYPRTQNRIALQSMAMTIGVATAVALVGSVVAGIYFPSIGSVIAMVFSIIGLSASAVFWWRIFNRRSDKALRQMYNRADETEENFEKQLAQLTESPRFTPEMALRLHDDLLRNSPLTWYPMIFATDRTVIKEFGRRLESSSQTKH